MCSCGDSKGSGWMTSHSILADPRTFSETCLLSLLQNYGSSIPLCRNPQREKETEFRVTGFLPHSSVQVGSFTTLPMDVPSHKTSAKSATPTKILRNPPLFRPPRFFMCFTEERFQYSNPNKWMMVESALSYASWTTEVPSFSNCPFCRNSIARGEKATIPSASGNNKIISQFQNSCRWRWCVKQLSLQRLQ